jgi:hypothetical protein
LFCGIFTEISEKMVQFTGTYKLERNENLDEFYTAAGIIL